VPEPAKSDPPRWRTLAVGLLLTAYFVWFTRSTLWVHFAADDLMNIHYYWQLPPWQRIFGPLMLWRPLYRPMAAWFFLPVLSGFGMNPVAFRVAMLAFLWANVFLIYRLSRWLGCGERAALLNALKDELFAVESEKIAGTLPPAEYAEVKAALETVLRRALRRK